MNNDDSDFERELRQLAPLAPRAALEHRLEAALGGRTPRTVDVAAARAPWWHTLGFARPIAALLWGAVTPAAAVAAVVMLHTTAAESVPRPLPKSESAGQSAAVPPTVRTADPSESIASASQTDTPVASSVLYQARDDGVILRGGGSPVRQISCRSEDTVAWRDPKTGAQWEVSCPREDVYLLPVRVQ